MTTIKLQDLDRLRNGSPTGPRAYDLIERFDITLPDRVLRASLWRSNTNRNSRRIQVRDLDGGGLFDTDDCYGIANATNKLDLWLEATFPTLSSRSA